MGEGEGTEGGTSFDGRRVSSDFFRPHPLPDTRTYIYIPSQRGYHSFRTDEEDFWCVGEGGHGRGLISNDPWICRGE